MSLLFAYTPIVYDSEWPPHVSLTHTGDDFTLLVRSPCSPERQEIAAITMTKDAARELGDALLGASAFTPALCTPTENKGE